MFYTEKLNNHLEEIDQSAEEMFEQLVKQLSAIEGGYRRPKSNRPNGLGC